MAWPPTASCELCYVHVPDGYVGPAVGDYVRFPDSDTHFTCEPCARELLHLLPGELANENCITPGCSGNEHENMVIASCTELPASATDEAAIAYFSTEYSERGWRVMRAVPDSTFPGTTGSQAWRVFFVSRRKLW